MYSLFRYTGCYIVVHRLPVTICTHRSDTLDVTKSSTDCLWRYVLTVPIHWMLHSRPQIACDDMYSPFRYTGCYKVVHRLPVTICTHRSDTLDVTQSPTDCLWRYVLTVPIHWMLQSRPQIACDYMYSPFRYTGCYIVVHRLPVTICTHRSDTLYVTKSSTDCLGRQPQKFWPETNNIKYHGTCWNIQALSNNIIYYGTCWNIQALSNNINYHGTCIFNCNHLLFL